jgi:hypothetical protein
MEAEADANAAGQPVQGKDQDDCLPGEEEGGGQCADVQNSDPENYRPIDIRAGLVGRRSGLGCLFFEVVDRRVMLAAALDRQLCHEGTAVTGGQRLAAAVARAHLGGGVSLGVVANRCGLRHESVLSW